MKVLVVDDHPLMRRGLRALVEESSAFEVCGESDNAPEATAMGSRLQPDFAIVDIGLKSANGIELTKALHAQLPALKILVVSMQEETTYAERALRAGAMGYLMKAAAADNIVEALLTIQRGDIYVSERVKEKMLQRYLSPTMNSSASSLDVLSDRELEVLDLIGNGYGTPEIARRLGLSVKTIDAHREHLKTKLKLTSATELARYAIEWRSAQGSG